MPATSYVPYVPLADYRDRFAEHFVLDRNDGVLEVRMHTGGAEAVWSLELHRAIGQLCQAIGADPENELLIFSGTGRYWLRGWDAHSFEAVEGDDETFRQAGFQHWYHDGRHMQERLVCDLDIPTIAVFNGPGVHAEFALFCDLTLCADDARMVEPHVSIGLVPGDGMFLALQHLLGPKRANHIMYTAAQISAAEALEWGLVNEVLPREHLMRRARELAASIMQIDPTVRRITTQVVRRPWRKLLAQDFELHFAHEMWGALVDRKPHGAPGPSATSG
jgi:enoyl-CoA hydratase/carnithine racemase